MDDLHNKYLNDPEFHNLVDMFILHIRAGKFTPSELRGACTYAATRWEQYQARPSWRGLEG
jgi:hypothetical protein